jgi:hypothetical protein
MNEDRINQIKDSIRELMREIVSRGKPLSSEVKLKLRQVLEHASNRIQQLRQEEMETQVPTEQVPTEQVPMPIGADLLWNLSKGNPDVFVSYLRTVPDPSLNQLLLNPAQLYKTINQLQQKFPQAAPQQVEGINKADLNSSNIWGFKYNPKNGRLFVRFQKGPIYEYEGVPSYIYNIFQKGAVPAKTKGSNEFGSWWVGKQPSLGAAFYDVIRNSPYEYQRVA